MTKQNYGKIINIASVGHSGVKGEILFGRSGQEVDLMVLPFTLL